MSTNHEYKTQHIIDHLMQTVERQWQEDTDFLIQALKNPRFESSVVGSYTVYNPRQRVAYTAKSSNWIGLPLSPSSVARKVITDALEGTGRKSFTRNKNAEHMAELSHPLLAQTTIGELIYIDLKGAHFNIYKRLPVHLFFTGEHMCWSSDFIDDFLPVDWSEYKLARNCLAGIFRGKSITRIKGGKLVTQEIKSPTYSPSHWGFIQTTLNWIACKAKVHGARYIYTDGYIFPTDADVQGFTDFLDTWKFPWGIKGLGQGYIAGVGRYSINGKNTARTNHLPNFDNLKEPCKMEEWLETLHKLKNGLRTY